MMYGDLSYIYKNDWATRIWTIQEQLLASKSIVMCGDSSVTWEQFMNFLCCIPVRWVSIYRELSQFDFQRMDAWFIRAAAGAEKEDFSTGTKHDLIVYLTSLSLLNGCSDPLDKIYAIYGLLEDNFQHLPIVDYTRDKAGLYENFTRVTIESTEKFWPASLSWRKKPVSDLPSWVPDMAPISDSTDRSGWRTQTLLFRSPNAALDSKLNLRTLQTSKTGTIALKARAYTTIKKFVVRWPGLEQPTAEKVLYFHRHILFSWCSEGLEYPYNKRGGISSPLGEFLMSELPFKPPKLPLFFTWIEKCSYLDLNQADKEDAFPRLRPQGLTNGEVWGFITAITRCFAEQIPFQTATGHFGRTIGHIEQGDTIALLAGSDYPAILRQEGKNWRYIAPACIQGIMNGEAWPQDTNTDEMETFILI